MNVQEIIKEIDKLTLEERVDLYKSLGEKIKRVEHLKAVLDNFVGRGKNVYGIDPQEYINQIRDDRF